MNSFEERNLNHGWKHKRKGKKRSTKVAHLEASLLSRDLDANQRKPKRIISRFQFDSTGEGSSAAELGQVLHVRVSCVCVHIYFPAQKFNDF